MFASAALSSDMVCFASQSSNMSSIVVPSLCIIKVEYLDQLINLKGTIRVLMGQLCFQLRIQNLKVFSGIPILMSRKI